MADDLTLKVAGAAISGWTELRVTRGIERCPSTFDISMTELFPGNAAQFVIEPGAPCQVLLGGDLVVTGYVDAIAPTLTGGQHILRVTGRGKCEDLVDCAAEWAGGQISGTSALDIATKLAQPYGITVTGIGSVGGSIGAVAGAGVGDGGASVGTALAIIPQFNLMIGETAYDIIERVCRASQLLCFEDAKGNLVLAQAGGQTHASGVAQGQNLQEGHAEYSLAERYSEYDCWLQSMETLGDLGNNDNIVSTARDPGVTRNRKHFIICDGGGQGLALAQARVNWEMNRRIGRGTQLTVTVDSWRDTASVLWSPNNVIPVDAPALKSNRASAWLIGEVSYFRDERGTHAELHLMPPQAFQPEPFLVQPTFPDLTPTVGGQVGF